MNKKCYICVDKTNDYHRSRNIANLFSAKPVFRCVVARIAGFLFIIMDFIVKKEWINSLSLKGNKLMIYAIIDSLKCLCQRRLLIKSVQSVGEPDIYKIIDL